MQYIWTGKTYLLIQVIHLKGLYTITKTNLLERLHKFEGGGERSGVHRSRRTSREGETPDEIRYYPSMERHLVSVLSILPLLGLRKCNSSWQITLLHLLCQNHTK